MDLHTVGAPVALLNTLLLWASSLLMTPVPAGQLTAQLVLGGLAMLGAGRLRAPLYGPLWLATCALSAVGGLLYLPLGHAGFIAGHRLVCTLLWSVLAAAGWSARVRGPSVRAGSQRP